MQRNVAGFKLVSLCAIATCGVVPLAVQHCTGQSEKPVSRTWTDDAGHRIEAVFLRADAEKVYLKRTDGVEGAVPLARLSEADRQYVQRRIAAPVTISADKTVEQLVTQLEDEDCEYRIAAMEALRRMGPRAAPALPELKKALLDKDHGVYLAAVDAIAAVGPAAKSAIDELSKLAWDRTGEGTELALRALMQIGPDGVAAIERMLDSPDEGGARATSVRVEAARALMRLGPKAKSSLPALEKAVTDRNEQVRWAAADALVAVRCENVELLQGLLKTLPGDQPLVALGMMGPRARDALPAMEAIANDLASPRRLQARWAVRAIATDPVSALEESLRSRDKKMRLFAVRRCAALGPEAKRLVPLLLPIAHEGRPEERSVALRTLVAISLETPEVVREALVDKDQDVRRSAAFALFPAGRERELVLPIVAGDLQRGNRQTASEIIDALADMGPKALPILRKLLQSEPGIHPDRAARALALIGPAALPTLQEVLLDDKGNPFGRLSATSAMRRIGPPAVPVLQEILRSSDRRASALAAQTLGWMGAKAKVAVPDLERFVKDEKGPLLSREAVAALGRLAPKSRWAERALQMQRTGAVMISLRSAAQNASPYRRGGIWDFAVPEVRTREARPSWADSVSWRLPPFPGIFQAYDRTLPWDSAKNKALLDRIPEIYVPAGGDKDGRTTLLWTLGTDPKKTAKDLLWLLEQRHGRRHPEGWIDETVKHPRYARRMILVEVGRDVAVPWTKPQDLSYDPENPLAAMGRIPDEGFVAGFSDGFVTLVRKDIAAKAFNELVAGPPDAGPSAVVQQPQVPAVEVPKPDQPGKDVEPAERLTLEVRLKKETITITCDDDEVTIGDLTKLLAGKLGRTDRAKVAVSLRPEKELPMSALERVVVIAKKTGLSDFRLSVPRADGKEAEVQVSKPSSYWVGDSISPPPAPRYRSAALLVVLRFHDNESGVMVGDAQWRPEQHLSPIALKDGEALANSVAAWYAKLSDEQRKVALVIIGAALAEAGARGPNCGELATVVSACAKSGCAFVWMAAASPDRDFLHPGTRSDSAATPAGRGFGGFGGFGGVDVIHSFPEPPVAEQPTEEPELLREESPRKPSGDLPPFAPRH